MLFFFQVFICLIGATMSEFLTAELGPAHNDYLRVLGGSKDPKQNPALKALLKFGTWMLLFANLVPISLIVSMELVKFFQAQFIQWDITIYDRPRDLPCKVQTSNLNEQLGQVDYVFSDKTGTLTCNIMTYKKMSIGKYSYGVDKPNALDLDEKDVTNFSMQDADFDQHLKNRRHDNYNNIINMLQILGVCHTVVIETRKGKDYYNASSPDELALVNCAKYYGWEFKGRDDYNRMEVQVGDKKEFYELLQVMEFTSGRKRMSVIVKNTKD